MSTYLYSTVAWTPDSIDTGNETTKDITVTGATVGDIVQVSFSLDLADTELTAAVVADDSVTASLSSRSGTVNLGAGTLRVRVTTLSGLHVT